MVKYVVSGLCLLWLLTGCGSDATRAINRQLDELVTLAEFAEQEPMLKAASRASRLGTYFTEDVEIVSSLLPMAVRSRSDLVALAAQLRSRYAGLTLSVSEKHILLHESGHTADMQLVVTARINGFGQSQTEHREFEILWRHTDDGWLIARAEPLKTIRRP